MGIARARAAAESAQAVLCVLDASRPLEEEDRAALDLAAKAPHWALVLNKTDLSPAPIWQREILETYAPEETFSVSAKSGQVEPVAAWLAALAPQPGEVLVTSARQAHLLEQARQALSHARESARAGMTADAFLMDAEQGIDLLGQVTGETASADMAHEIFSRFCVGK